jgi:uncharacterized protein YlxW (UPF0749 family)
MDGNLNRLTIFILMVLFGFLAIMQMKAINMGSKHVLLNDIRTIQNNILSESKQVEALNAELITLQNKVRHYADAGDSQMTVTETITQELNHYKALSGLFPLEGQGVIVIIDDAERELYLGEEPSTVMVHDVDIRNIVDDLKNAGAEAISINGERFLMGHSRIICNGPTITINDKQYAQPFIIKAIGNRKHLEAAVNAPGSYGSVLRDWGIFIEVNTTVSLRVPAFTSRIQYTYSISKESEN